MKQIHHLILTTVAVLLCVSTIQSFAIEGLKLSIHCPDVWLSIPSVEGETFIVQRRETLDANSAWATLANSLPAASGTNRTIFVDSNRVACPIGQISGMMMSGGDSWSGSVSEQKDSEPTAPMVMFKDGSRAPVPLAIYPPGFDLSGHIIIWPDGSVDEWSKELGEKYKAILEEAQGGPQPADAGGGGGSLGCGFYRVVRNGVHLVGITNGATLSGMVTISVEAGNDLGTLTSLSLNEDGAPVSDVSSQESPFSSPLALTMDTTRMSNGVHQIYAQASWYIPGADDPYYQAFSPVVTINVFNEISFPNWMPQFGQEYDALYITAQSAHADADWYIDVYGGDSGYIGTFQGHTYDGNIEVVWNLIGPPPNYPSYANEPNFDFVVETVFNDGQGVGNGPQAAGGASALAPGTRKNWDHWNVPGDWVVANQLFWGNWVGGDKLNEMADTFADMAISAFGLTVRPNHDYLQAFRIPYNTGGTTEIDKWRDFRQALYEPHTRNLFYSGHGSCNGIGYDASNTNVFIPRAEIASALHTVPAGQTNRHAFRFVFLDGCESASGHLPEAFGIIREKNLEANYYIDSGQRYSSFVGWNTKPTIGAANHLVNTDHWKFVMNFKYLWFTTSLGLRESLNKATGKVPGVITPEGPNNVDPNDLTVYGYKDLWPNQHNGL